MGSSPTPVIYLRLLMECGVVTRIEETYRHDAKFTERKQRKETLIFQAFSSGISSAFLGGPGVLAVGFPDFFCPEVVPPWNPSRALLKTLLNPNLRIPASHEAVRPDEPESR